MKLIHLSDLHLGKRVKEFSMIEDQEFILTKIINIIDDEKPQAVLIAGDVYDKSIPTIDGVRLFDSFLERLVKRGLQVFIISGNHDSMERLSFGAGLMNASGIHIAKDAGAHFVLEDEFGPVNFYLLPYLRPNGGAVESAIADMNLDTSERNILLSHQFVLGAELSEESEELNIGGLDCVEASIYKDFDYVALGHIHRPQMVGKNLRYCGTPLAYSFSEAGQQKSVTVVEVGEKRPFGKGEAVLDGSCAGCIKLYTRDLVPKRAMREMRGLYDELMKKDFYENTAREDYLRITLTDEEEIPEGFRKLAVVYPNLMRLDYDNTRTRERRVIKGADTTVGKDPKAYFAEFFELQNNMPLSSEQEEFLQSCIDEIWGRRDEE